VKLLTAYLIKFQSYICYMKYNLRVYADGLRVKLA